MYRDQCSKTLYRTPLQPGWWLEGNQAMKSLKLLMFAALMVAMARALSLIPGKDHFHKEAPKKNRDEVSR